MGQKWKKPDPEKTYYSIQEAAEILSVHPNTIRNRIKDGSLPAGRVGYQWRIAAEDLRAMLEPKNRRSKN